jgi:hypothetical protein
LLVVLALAPDLAMVAYAAGPRVGATAYDLVHTYLTHIGVDRAIGYGLKHPSGFKDPHLQRV